MKNTLAVLIVIFTIFFFGSCAESPASETARLKGRWNLTEEFYQGKKMPAEDTKTVLVFNADSTWHVEAGGETVAGGTFKVDPSTRPKTIDYGVTQGEDSGKTFYAIYDISGDNFKHCGERGGARPQTFESKTDTEIFLTVFKRE